jgi:hypothetical protein
MNKNKNKKPITKLVEKIYPTTTTAAVSLLNILTEVVFSKYSILAIGRGVFFRNSYSSRSSGGEWWKHFGLFGVIGRYIV